MSKKQKANAERACRAQATLAHYKYEQLKESGEPDHETINDLITDILHLIDAQSKGREDPEYPFFDSVATAIANWRAERVRSVAEGRTA